MSKSLYTELSELFLCITPTTIISHHNPVGYDGDIEKRTETPKIVVVEGFPGDMVPNGDVGLVDIDVVLFVAGGDGVSRSFMFEEISHGFGHHQ